MILSCQNIRKSYGQNHALRDFTLTMTPGIYALLGPNGAGKSTLMNILTDNLSADEGSITFAEDGGAPEDIRAMGARFRERLGYMPQYPGLYPSFTVSEFLAYMAVLKHVGDRLPRKARKAYIREQISAILDRVELTEVAERRISSLSGGMKQRLALAQAVLGEPDVLILDEPTAGLDPKQRIAVRTFIAEIALNRIVLIATHVVSDVESIAREVILLRRGEVVEVASPAALTAAMEGKVWHAVVPPDEVTRMKETHRVVNLQSGDAGVMLRLLCTEKPCADATPATPCLEDAYLAAFGERENVEKMGK